MRIQLFDIENWKEIGATLARNKTRTFLTAFGIFWGVFMLACLMGGARGAEDLLASNFDGFATNSAIIVPGITTKPYEGHAKGRRWEANMTDMERLRTMIPSLTTVTGTLSTNSSFRNGRYSYTGTVQGVEESFSKVMLPRIASGRFINDADNRLQRKVAVVGKKIANELFPGNPNPVGESILINGISYTIVGTAYQTSNVNVNSRIDEQVIIPLTTYQKAYNKADKVEMLMLVGSSTANFTQLEERIRHLLYIRHQIDPADSGALWFLNIAEHFEQLDTLFTGISFLAFFIGLSTLIAGIIGIGNIMWVIVKERTREFGVRRAIGARPSDVTAQILSEGIALTAIAGMAGISLACLVLGITAAATATEVCTPRFQMNLSQALIIIIAFIVLGSLAGLIPAIKAMRIKPIEALNSK